MEKIWCVEDEKSIRDILLYTLRSCGYEGKGFETGDECLRALEKEIPDLLLLDIMLPGIDGVSLLKKIRLNPQTTSLPIIMTTAKGIEYDKIEALEAGADDYLVKPFGMMEMTARIRAVLRRSKPKVPSYLESGRLRLDLEGHRAWIDETLLELTPKEFALLNLFLHDPDHLFSREELFHKVWGEHFIAESRSVDVHIASLRTKLKEESYRIETVRGIGYRLRTPK